MRQTLLVVSCCVALASPAFAQTSVADLKLPELTTDQMWTRSAWQFTVMIAGVIHQGKAQGKSVDQIAKEWVTLFAPSWGKAGSGKVDAVARAMYRNQRMFPGGEMQFTAVAPARVSGTFNRPWVKFFGDTETLYGTTRAEYEQFFTTFMRGVAQHLGLQYDSQLDPDLIAFTISDARVATR